MHFVRNWVLPFIGPLNQKAKVHIWCHFKAMDDIGVVMTPIGDVVTVILVVNNYVCTLILQSS